EGSTPDRFVEKLMDRLSQLPHAATRSGEETADDVRANNLEATEEGIDFLMPAQSENEIGRLGPYRILKVLGAGGMGIVFQAEDEQLQRLVALKAMRPALASSKRAKERFLLEARATAKIKHDHIVTIYQV